MSLRSITPAVAVLACASPSLADVLVVDASGGGDFTYPMAAIDAAADGDTVLIRPGEYADFFLDGKGLYVVAETPGTVTIQAGIVIEDLAAGQRAVLSGLVIQGNVAALPEALWVIDCAGSVRLEGCELSGADSWVLSLFGNGNDGAFVAGSSAVSFAHCTLQAGSANPGQVPCPQTLDTYHGGIGLAVKDSTVSLHACSLSGGQGGLGAGCLRAGTGGAGLHASTSSVYAAGSQIAGGLGGKAFTACDCGGNGGAALSLDASTADLLDVALTPGLPSPGSASGAPGATTELQGGATLDLLPGTAPALIAPAAVTGSAAFSLTVGGDPGDLVVLAASTAPAWLYAPILHGPLLLAFPLALNGLALGPIDGSGTQVTALTAPALPLGLEGATFFLQAAAVTPVGGIYLTGARTVHVLAAGLLP